MVKKNRGIRRFFSFESMSGDDVTLHYWLLSNINLPQKHKASVQTDYNNNQ